MHNVLFLTVLRHVSAFLKVKRKRLRTNVSNRKPMNNSFQISLVTPKPLNNDDEQMCVTQNFLCLWTFDCLQQDRMTLKPAEAIRSVPTQLQRYWLPDFANMPSNDLRVVRLDAGNKAWRVDSIKQIVSGKEKKRSRNFFILHQPKGSREVIQTVAILLVLRRWIKEFKDTQHLVETRCRLRCKASRSKVATLL